MAGNKYEKYLNDKRDTPGFMDLIDTGIKTTGKIVGAAALIGGGYSGFKKLSSSGVLDDVASTTKRFLNSDALIDGISTARKSTDLLGAYAKGFDDTVKSSGLIRTLTGGASKEFKSNLTEHITRASSGITRDLSSKPTHFEKLISDMSNIKSKIGTMAYDSARIDVIKESIDFTLKGHKGDIKNMDAILKNIVDQEAGNKKLRNIERGKDGHKQISEILKKHNMDSILSAHDYTKAHTALNKAFIEGSGAKDELGRNRFIRANKDVIQKKMEGIQKQYDQSIEASLKKESKLGSFIEKATGYRRVKVGEAIESGLLKKEIPHKYKPIELHDKQYIDAISNTKKNIHINDSHRIGSQVLGANNNIGNAYLDPLVFRNRSGKVIDARFMRDTPVNIIRALGDSIQVPFVNIKPFRMVSDIFGMSRGEMPNFAKFSKGSIMPTIEESMKKGLSKEYMYFNGRLVDDSGNLIKDNTYLASARFGPWQRVTNAVSGVSRHADLYDEPRTVGEFVKTRIFGFGQQEFPSDLKRKGSILTKFADPRWGRNVFDNVKNLASTGMVADDDMWEFYKVVNRSADNSSIAFDRETLSYLRGSMDGVLSGSTLDDLVDGPRDRSVINAVKELIDSESTDLIYGKKLRSIYNDYMKDPDSFDRISKVYKSSREYVMPDMMESVSGGTSDVLTKMDEAEKILHSEILHQIEKKNHVTVGSLISDMYDQGFSQQQIKNLKNVNILKELQSVAGENYMPGYGIPLDEGSLKKLAGFATNKRNTPLWDDIEDSVYNIYHNLGYGPGERYGNIMGGNEFLLMQKTRRPTKVFKDALERMNREATEGNRIIKAGKEAWDDTIHQFGFGAKGKRAGRDNIEGMTTLSYASYFYGFRLNEAISKLGIGLSVRDMGSAQDIWLNLAAKRLAAPLVAVSAAKYVNDEIGNITGEKPTQSISKGYAQTTVGVQTIKEITGLNALGEHMSNIMPGANRIVETPAGRILKKATFGIIGETRSPSEMIEYYQRGVDPVRKGRFWSIGSNTPVYGDRIMYYEPNSYRKSIADPMMTDVMYGSTAEYWSNHWLPNPRNPLGLLKPGRRRHWELKHWEERPYPVSSSGLEEIPIVGPILDGTIGRIIRPFRRRPGLEKAHREYLTDINEMIAQRTEKMQSPGYVYITPGGRMTPSDINYGKMVQGEDGIVFMDPSMKSVEGYAGGSVVDSQEAVTIVDPSRGFISSGAGAKFNRAALTDINTAIVNKGYVSARDPRSIQSLRDNMFVENLDEAVDPNSLAYRLGKTYYSMTELGGIYGFATTTMLGDYSPDVSLQSSLRMMGFERKFWDKELGGFGGELSEIGRRFLPHRDRQSIEYNPFKNKMPSWMPGPEYFTDFRHGDPYVKIQQGELRLPGAGYEALNKLHSDPIFGRYGALDRFKILADVAPYSEQYRYYSSVVSKMKQQGMISEEDYSQVAEIRDQVSQKKKKYDFHPYKFKNADIIQEEVTVRRWIDANTFLTYEHPGAPIKLAGISMPGLTDESDAAKTAREMAEKYISPGKKIRIGLDADALNRVRDDTTGSMEAVVYDAFGDSVNAKLAKYKPAFSDSPVKADYDDTSSTSVQALYSSNAITVGKVWESFAHMDTPFHTKFLQIRSPLEMYKRKELYGKSWQSWGNPISDFIVPMMDKHTASNPLVATARGAAFGYLIGAKGRVKKYTAFAGALASGIVSSVRTVGDFAKRTVLADSDATFIPKRRQEQREIDEYFDFIKYLKYRGLYEKTRKLAIVEEGIDPETYVKISESKPNSRLMDKLSDAKRWLKINKSHYYADKEQMQQRLDSINSIMNDIQGTSMLAPAGPYTMQALKYRQEYLSTLYGADPHGDFTNIYRALPKKDRPFFKEFMLADPDEREEILRLVPKNQRRFYQAKWGLEMDRKPSLTEMAARFNIPGAGWEGWDPEYSMDEIKIKFIHNKGMELGEFGYWKDDYKKVTHVPKAQSVKGLPFTIDKIALEDALKGAGITDLEIRADMEYLDEEPDSFINVGVNMMFNRRKEAVDLINANMAALI
jgi:hypothetical protein